MNTESALSYSYSMMYTVKKVLCPNSQEKINLIYRNPHNLRFPYSDETCIFVQKILKVLLGTRKDDYYLSSLVSENLDTVFCSVRSCFIT